MTKAYVLEMVSLNDLINGYLELQRIKDMMQEALNQNRITYVGISVADSVEVLLNDRQPVPWEFPMVTNDLNSQG